MTTKRPYKSRRKEYTNEHKEKVFEIMMHIYNECKKDKQKNLQSKGKELKVGNNITMMILKHYTKKTGNTFYTWTTNFPTMEMVDFILEECYIYGKEKNALSLSKKIEQHMNEKKNISDLSFDAWCNTTSLLEFMSDDHVLDYILDSETTDTIAHFNAIPGGMPEEKLKWLKENVLKKKYKSLPVEFQYEETPIHISATDEMIEFEKTLESIDAEIRERYKKGISYVPIDDAGRAPNRAMCKSVGKFEHECIEGDISSIKIRNEKGSYYYANGIYAAREKVVEPIPVEKKQPELISCTPVKSNPQPVQTILEMSTEEANVAEKRIAEALNKPVKIKKPVTPKDKYVAGCDAMCDEADAVVIIHKPEKGADHDIDKEFVPEQGQSLIATEKKKEVVKEISILWGAFKFKVYGNK